MTTRTLTEVRDNDPESDLVTLIRVGPSLSYCAEIEMDQWQTGERESDTAFVVELELDDAIALRDALTRCIDEAKEREVPDAE